MTRHCTSKVTFHAQWRCMCMYMYIYTMYINMYTACTCTYIVCIIITFRLHKLAYTYIVHVTIRSSVVACSDRVGLRGKIFREAIPLTPDMVVPQTTTYQYIYTCTCTKYVLPWSYYPPPPPPPPPPLPSCATVG